MRLIVTYGHILSGTGSNVYVQTLCRGVERDSHDVHLLCQEADLLGYDLVSEHPTVEEETIDRKGAQDTTYPGRCTVETGGLLPVYDEYPGWRVKTFLDLIEEKE